MNIDDKYNFDDNFIRMTTIGLCKVFATKISWINRWSDGKKIRVLIPFYTPFAGQERFMLDAFVDDTVSTRAELNTDQKQRGIVTFKGGTQRDDEFANPNQYLSKDTKINDQFKSVVSRTMAVPVSFNFDIEIRLDSENEVHNCYTSILDTIFNYRFFNISYFGIKIDAFFRLPADTGIDVPRQSDMSSEERKTIKFSIEVMTYYPVFTTLSDDYEICDNDDSIDWNFLGKPKPSDLAASGNTISNSLGALKRVHWYNNLVDGKDMKVIIKENEDNRQDEINNME